MACPTMYGRRQVPLQIGLPRNRIQVIIETNSNEVLRSGGARIMAAARRALVAEEEKTA